MITESNKEFTKDDRELEEAKQRAKEATELLLPNAAGFGFTLPVIKGFCRVCGNKQEMDADFMGPGCAGFSFFPCQHSVEYYKDAEFWYNADGSRVDADDLHEESESK